MQTIQGSKQELNPIPQWVYACAVKDCQTVAEFAFKYRKKERFSGRGKEYEKAILASHHEEIASRGWTSISKHDNVTGELITFIAAQ